MLHYYDEWEKAWSSGFFNIMSHMDFYKIVLGLDWFKANRGNQLIFERAKEALENLSLFDI